MGVFADILEGMDNKKREKSARMEKRDSIENLPPEEWHPELIDIYQIFTYSKLKEMHLEANCPFDVTPGHVNLWGVRNRKRVLFDDRMCDIIGAAWLDKDTRKQKVARYQGTTRPGKHYVSVKHMLNKLGAAILIPGYHKDIWVIGTHRGKHYPCLVSRKHKGCLPTTIGRDFDHDGLLGDDESRHVGWNGINCHMGWWGKKIKRSSAGCQVVADPREHRRLMDIAMNDPRYKKSKNFRFSYSLLIH